MFRKDSKAYHIHLVGIGGSGMSGIAEVLLNLGYEVSGSDLREGEALDHLRSLGGRIEIGHKAANIDGADVVVTSTAISGNNVEAKRAKKEKIPVIPRAEMLSELMRLKYGIAVSGAHGKTTTTSMISLVLAQGGLDPTMVIGGRFNNIGSNARLGGSDYLVAEADESDGSFLKLSPIIAVVTNIDREHLDYYKDLDQIKAAFLTFINKVAFYGCAIVCLDDPNVRDLIDRAERRIITYGVKSEEADVRAKDLVLSGLSSEFTVVKGEEPLGRLRVSFPGIHYVNNSLAACACGLELGISFSDIAQAILSYRSVQRRFQIKANIDEVMIIDDYAHHPTEIRATLDSIRTGFPTKRIIVVFQPHRYSRTNFLHQELAGALSIADEIILAPIYPAGESEMEGVDASLIAKSLESSKKARVISDFDRIVETLRELAKPGDLVLTLGAGNIYQVADELVKQLSK